MSKLRVHNLSMSFDGYSAGHDQSLEQPLGRGGEQLHEWMFATRTMRRLMGEDGGTVGVDDAFVARAQEGVGATIMGRNMYGPVRGDWDPEMWTGWWGEEPPFHHPVVVLTHHAAEPIEMAGGTSFHFVADGIESALEQARDAAGELDVAIGGGASTIQQYLHARLIDDLHVAVLPILLGSGTRLFDHLDGGPEGYRCVELVSSPSAVHARFERAD
jgi:dihydrofolate reductase